MKKYAFITLLFVTSIFYTEVNAQCSGIFNVNNASGDDWTISIHNVDIPIPAGFAGPVPYSGGLNTASVGAYIASPGPFCGWKFQGISGIIPTACAPNTNLIFFQKTAIDLNGCVTAANVAFF